MTREEAIKIIRQEYKCVDAECDIERNCGKCEYHMPSKEPILKAYDMAIHALSQEPCDEDDGWIDDEYGRSIRLEQNKTEVIPPLEPCDDAISREAVLKIIDKWYENKSDIEDLIILITYMSSVTQKSGEWINDKNDIPICSQCGYIPQFDRAIDDYEYSNYCPSCGCRMVEPQESEE